MPILSRFRRRCCRLRVGWPAAVALLLLVSLYLTLFESSPDADLLLELSKCPACYGTNLCWAFRQNSTPDGRPAIRLNRQTIWERLFNSKNVHDASLGDQKLVIKKLAHDWELDVLDRMLCGMDGLVGWHGARPDPAATAQVCDVGETWRGFVGAGVGSLGRVAKVLEVARSALDERGVVPDVIRCPPERFLGLLFGADNVSKQLGSTVADRATVLTVLMVNPEPLLLNIFNTFSPFFPRLVGSCGRLVAVAHAGSTLDHSLQRPLEHRFRIVAQLLLLVRQLSAAANPFNLNFYLTDVSYDNFAVSDDAGGNETSGSHLRVTMVDVEGVVVTDGQRDAGPAHSGLRSDVDVAYDSRSGFSFSFDDLCSGGSVVNACHNHRAICRCLLSDEPCSPMNVPVGGLLWGIPAEIEDRWRIRETIRSCASDSPPRCIFSCRKLTEIVEQVINYLDATVS